MNKACPNCRKDRRESEMMPVKSGVRCIYCIQKAESAQKAKQRRSDVFKSFITDLAEAGQEVVEELETSDEREVKSAIIERLDESLEREFKRVGNG